MEKIQKHLITAIKHTLTLLIFFPIMLFSHDLTKTASTHRNLKNSGYKDVSCVNINNQMHCVAICSTEAPDVMHYTNDGGKTWLKQFALDESPQYGFELRGVNCTNYQSKPVCVGIGVYYTLGHELHTWTFIIRNEDGSSHWLNNSPSWMQFDQLSSIKCFAAGLCFASGSDATIESIDSGFNWSRLTVSNVQCVRTASKNICLGIDYDEPKLLSNEEGDSDWKVLPIQDFPLNSSQFSITSLSCSNEESDGICVLVGKYKDAYSRKKPFVAQSKDGAKTWFYQNADSNFPNGILNAVSCSPTKKPTVCAAVGEADNNKPLIVQTTNGGLSWHIKLIGNDGQGFLRSIYCGNRKKAASYVCTAVGAHLAVQNDDSDDTWHTISLTGKTDEQNYNKITCTTNSKKELCVVVGSTLVQSEDGRKTWQIVNVK